MRLTITYNRVVAFKLVGKVAALMTVMALLVWPIQISHAALAGDMDLAFGSAGIAIADFGGIDVARAVVIQPDGRIVSAGYTLTSRNFDFALARHNVDGSLDMSFGNSGQVSTDFGGGDLALDVALQSDGKIVSVGTTSFFNGLSTVVKWAITRHNSDGSLDPSFGNNGLVLTQVGENWDHAFGVAVQPDGKIVVAGTASLPTAFGFGLARYNSDGSLDSSFGSGGIVIVPPIVIDDRCNDVVIRPNGKILAAGVSRVYEPVLDDDFLLVQFNSDGTVDQSFGNNGVVTTDFNGALDTPYNIAQQSDGKIVLAGGSAGSSGQRFALARYNTDGSIDGTFGSNGRVLTSLGAWTSLADSVAIASDGKIVAAGSSNPGSSIAVTRYTTDGLLDSSFGSGGQIISAFPSAPGARWNVALQSDDKIVVAGSVPAGGTSDFALVRYESVSSPDVLIYRTTTLVNSFNLPAGTTSSLNSQLNDALAAVLAGNDAEACLSLQSFISHVQAQVGKKIPESQAQELLTAANDIRASIGCQ